MAKAGARCPNAAWPPSKCQAKAIFEGVTAEGMASAPPPGPCHRAHGEGWQSHSGTEIGLKSSDVRASRNLKGAQRHRPRKPFQAKFALAEGCLQRAETTAELS